MANELKHGSVGTELTQAEWEGIGTHVVANQAVGDLVFADTTSQLLRLGIGSTNDVLRVTGGKPDWQATTFITSLGTIATGVWQGTDVGVAYGGTGVSTLTANGVLVGNGASAIGSIDMSTKGHVLIGDGSGNPQMLGVGTNTHVMTADSGETTGVKWAAPAAAAAGSLTGSTLASGVTASSLTSLGTLTALAVGGNISIIATETLLIEGNSRGMDFGFLTGGVHIPFIHIVNKYGAGKAAELYVEGSIMIGDTANASMTTGLTVNMGDADNEALALKSSDVTHPMTALTEADTWFSVVKAQDTSGGATLQGFKDADGDGGLAWQCSGVLGEAADTTDTTSSIAVTSFDARVTDASTGATSVAADGNAFAFTNYDTVRLLIKGDGDIHATNVTSGQLDGTALDYEDDIGLVRAFERHQHNGIGILMSKWDEAIQANEDDLRRVGVLIGDFYSIQRMDALLGGAIWQGYKRQMEMQERIGTLESKLLAVEGAK